VLISNDNHKKLKTIYKIYCKDENYNKTYDEFLESFVNEAVENMIGCIKESIEIEERRF